MMKIKVAKMKKKKKAMKAALTVMLNPGSKVKKVKF